MTVATQQPREENNGVANQGHQPNHIQSHIQSRIPTYKLIFQYPANPMLLKRTVFFLGVMQLWNVWQAPIWTLFLEFMCYIFFYLELTITINLTNSTWLDIFQILYATEILRVLTFGMSFAFFLVHLLAWQYSYMITWFLMCYNIYQGVFSLETREA